jgi:hypothetical protein
VFFIFFSGSSCLVWTGSARWKEKEKEKDQDQENDTFLEQPPTHPGTLAAGVEAVVRHCDRTWVTNPGHNMGNTFR